MKKSLLLLSAVLLMVTPRADCAPKTHAGPVKKPPPPDYFPLKQDYWWKYKSKTADGKESDSTIKVPAVEKKEDGTVIYSVDTSVAVASAVVIHDWYTKPKGLVLRIREKYGDNENMSVDYDPPDQLIKNPLIAGDTWQWTGKGMMSVDIIDSSEVEPAEEVIVPAGKFKAMKVSSKVVQGGATATKTYWYAPWVGLVKSMTESGPVKSTTELLDYSFKKQPVPKK